MQLSTTWKLLTLTRCLCMGGNIDAIRGVFNDLPAIALISYEIICGRGVVFAKDCLHSIDFEKLLADRESLTDEGFLDQILNVILWGIIFQAVEGKNIKFWAASAQSISIDVVALLKTVFIVPVRCYSSIVVSFHHFPLNLELHDQFHPKWIQTAAVEISTYGEVFVVLQDSEQQLVLSGFFRRNNWLDSGKAGFSADDGDEEKTCSGLPSVVQLPNCLSKLQETCGLAISMWEAILLLALHYEMVQPTIHRHHADPVVCDGFRPLSVSGCSKWRGLVLLSLLNPKGRVMMLLLPCWQSVGSATLPMGSHREGLFHTGPGLMEGRDATWGDVATFGTHPYI
ncbi:uncharacterized protein [Aristolochia californica]|uniref:uncharacterized protein isoform X1 n=1 Tax=Aristolochia californica TaxID=171875 RepID=UPI0035DFB719